MTKDNVVRVLIVEDEPTDAEILRRSLTRLEVSSLETSFASTAREAKELLAKTTFDLLLLDLHLPDVVGYELIHDAKRLQKTLPVVVVTSLNDSDAALQVGRLGADDYIVKDDLMSSSLGRTVRRLLRSRLQELHPPANRPRLINESSDKIDTWLAWKFPTSKVPPITLSKNLQKEVKERYQRLVGISQNKKEAELRAGMREFENFAFQNKIPAETLITTHRELAAENPTNDSLGGRQRFVLFEMLAALLERYRSEEESSAAQA